MIMKNITLLTIFLFFLSVLSGLSQEGVVRPDSTQQKKTEAGSVSKNREQNQSKNQSQGQGQRQNQGQGGNALGQPGNATGQNAGQQVKQVRSARPDMSKARGARPPDIVRPSGSGVPKGIGRPGGAMRRGGR